MAYGYCFGCGIRVSTHDLRSGAGKRLPQGFCCLACAKGYDEARLLAGRPIDQTPSPAPSAGEKETVIEELLEADPDPVP